MSGLDSRLFCRLDGLSAAAREQQRLLVVADLGLLETDSTPVFEEAAQTAAQFLGTPISWLGVMDRDNLWVRASIGLSRLGLMNQIAKTRRLSREESFCTHVVDSHQVLAVSDALQHPALAQSSLVQQYNIRAYLGAPLVISDGSCIGTLAVMDSTARSFDERDIQVLELIARWCVSEYERDTAIAAQQSRLTVVPETFFDRQDHAPAMGTGGGQGLASPYGAANASPGSQATNADGKGNLPLQLQLVGQLTQQLRAPLTAVLGMAGMLSREIYGPLTDKQREYLDVIHRSGQTLLGLIQEIMDLAALEEGAKGLNLIPVDVELLCQQIIHSLGPVAEQRTLELRFSVEPGQRIWHLDKDRVRQMLYHLMFSIIQSANTDSVLRLHVSRKRHQLQFSLWVSHPWLGDGLPPGDGGDGLGILPMNNRELDDLEMEESSAVSTLRRSYGGRSALSMETAQRELPDLSDFLDPASTERPENLRLLLSRHLAEIQGGQLFVQSSLESGYRYIALLPITPEN